MRWRVRVPCGHARSRSAAGSARRRPGWLKPTRHASLLPSKFSSSRRCVRIPMKGLKRGVPTNRALERIRRWPWTACEPSDHCGQIIAGTRIHLGSKRASRPRTRRAGSKPVHDLRREPNPKARADRGTRARESGPACDCRSVAGPRVGDRARPSCDPRTRAACSEAAASSAARRAVRGRRVRSRFGDTSSSASRTIRRPEVRAVRSERAADCLLPEAARRRRDGSSCSAGAGERDTRSPNWR